MLGPSGQVQAQAKVASPGVVLIREDVLHASSSPAKIRVTGSSGGSVTAVRMLDVDALETLKTTRHTTLNGVSFLSGSLSVEESGEGSLPQKFNVDTFLAQPQSGDGVSIELPPSEIPQALIVYPGGEGSPREEALEVEVTWQNMLWFFEAVLVALIGVALLGLGAAGLGLLDRFRKVPAEAAQGGSRADRGSEPAADTGSITGGRRDLRSRSGRSGRAMTGPAAKIPEAAAVADPTSEQTTSRRAGIAAAGAAAAGVAGSWRHRVKGLPMVDRLTGGSAAGSAAAADADRSDTAEGGRRGRAAARRKNSDTPTGPQPASTGDDDARTAPISASEITSTGPLPSSPAAPPMPAAPTTPSAASISGPGSAPISSGLPPRSMPSRSAATSIPDLTDPQTPSWLALPPTSPSPQGVPTPPSTPPAATVGIAAIPPASDTGAATAPFTQIPEPSVNPAGPTTETGQTRASRNRSGEPDGSPAAPGRRSASKESAAADRFKKMFRSGKSQRSDQGPSKTSNTDPKTGERDQ
ncbi:hypothetical protein [Austwickia sp. TVS 96-490-7B]|uniref:hypothetical protein n=1 Tax=Austwickia sp. TVS 96-490-7B TaxID=2830843 RepID=UPI001C59C18E|nr:hypothetical protein [Austwickia sp. TVS 96-490-7B]